MVAIRPTHRPIARGHAVRRCALPRPGFTLTEVLVVVAILAVLASLLFPVFQAARATALRATCTSNLRQLAVAFTQYSRDYDDLLPPGGEGRIGNVREVERLWVHRIQPYFRDDRILHCPADSVRNADRTLSGGFPELADQPGLPALSYGASWDLMDAVTKGLPHARISTVPYPAHTLLVADCTEPWAFGPLFVDPEGIRWSHIAYANGPPLPTAATPMHGGRSGMGHERHGTGSMVAFVDGHVAHVPAARFTSRWSVEAGTGRVVPIQQPLLSPEGAPPASSEVP